MDIVPERHQVKERHKRHKSHQKKLFKIHCELTVNPRKNVNYVK